MTARRFALAALLSTMAPLAGCFNVWEAYEDPPPNTDPFDPHEPRTLARTMLRGASTVAYSDDGEHFGLRLCKAWRDQSQTCELGFGTREGLNDLWPVQAPAPSLDGEGGRLVVALLAHRLDDIDAHLMEDRKPGKSAMVAAPSGDYRVTLEGNVVRLAHVTERGPKGVVTLLAAARVEGAPPSEIVTNGSFRRRDAVAVELWHDVAEGPVARFNQWVLFFRSGEGVWRTVVVSGLRDEPRIYAAAKDAAPDPPKAPPPPAAPSAPPPARAE